jgi:cytochrome b
MKQPKISIKRIVSWAVGAPALLFAISEINDLRYWWVPFVAMGALVLILHWNHVFDEETSEPARFVSHRRSF